MGYECDLIATARTDAGEERGYLWLPEEDVWQTDRLGERIDESAMATLRSERLVTFTCMPPETGYRAGVDRDADFALDGDERDRGTDPTDATDFPADLRMDGGPPPMPDLGVGADMGPDAGTGTGGGGGCGCRVGGDAPLPGGTLRAPRARVGARLATAPTLRATRSGRRAAACRPRSRPPSPAAPRSPHRTRRRG